MASIDRPKGLALFAAAAVALGLCGTASAAPADIFAAVAFSASPVLDLGPAVKLRVIDDRNGEIGVRILSAGAEYGDGWRIAAVTAGSVTLQKDGQVHTVALQAISPAQRANRAALDAAIGQGDLAKVIALAGSSDDFNRAQAIKNPGTGQFGVRTLYLQNLGGGRTLILFDGVRLEDLIRPTPTTAP